MSSCMIYIEKTSEIWGESIVQYPIQLGSYVVGTFTMQVSLV